jgi:hypothetical protein
MKKELTCQMGSEGPSEEVTRMKSGLTVLFFGGGYDFERSFSAASSWLFSCESAVCLRAAS